MHPTRKLRLRRSRSAPRQGPEIRVYAVNREELHPVHSLDGTLRLCGDEDYPMSLFSARHGLTPKEVALAEALWRRANRLRPIDSTSHRGRCRLSLRMGGIISPIRRGTAGNSKWGRQLQGHHGGKTMAMHNLATLWANGEKASRRYAIRRQLGLRGH
jgi:hypothetical protein